MTPVEHPGAHAAARHLVVVGHGMVGHRLVEALRARDSAGESGASWRITVLAEESDAAYDRVGLTSYTESWDRDLLAFAGNDYPRDQPVRLAEQCDRDDAAVDGPADRRGRRRAAGSDDLRPRDRD